MWWWLSPTEQVANGLLKALVRATLGKSWSLIGSQKLLGDLRNGLHRFGELLDYILEKTACSSTSTGLVVTGNLVRHLTLPYH